MAPVPDTKWTWRDTPMEREECDLLKQGLSEEHAFWTLKDIIRTHVRMTEIARWIVIPVSLIVIGLSCYMALFSGWMGQCRTGFQSDIFCRGLNFVTLSILPILACFGSLNLLITRSIWEELNRSPVKKYMELRVLYYEACARDKVVTRTCCWG